MKHHSFTAGELILLLYHSICFLSALFFFFNGSRLCLLFILLLALQVPFMLLKDAAARKDPYTAQTEIGSLVPAGQEDQATVPAGQEDQATVPEGSDPRLPAAPPSTPAGYAETAPRQEQYRDGLQESALILPPFPAKEPDTLELITFCEASLREFTNRYGLFTQQAELLCEAKSLLLSTHRELFTLIIQNLLDNAFKYVKADTGHISRFTLTLTSNGPNALLIFRNHTKGVPQSEIPFLTRRNYQGSNKISGTGLGLFQAQAAVNALHGSLQIKSSPETGFAAYLELPGLTEYGESLPCPAQGGQP